MAEGGGQRVWQREGNTTMDRGTLPPTRHQVRNETTIPAGQFLTAFGCVKIVFFLLLRHLETLRIGTVVINHYSCSFFPASTPPPPHPTHIVKHTHTNTHTHTHARTHAHCETHTHTHARTHTVKHTHTHTHTTTTTTT